MEERKFLENCGYCRQNAKISTINLPSGGEKLDIKRIIADLDSFFAVEDLVGAESFLNTALDKSVELGDKTGQLSILSELMGFHRRTANKEAALRASNDGIKLIFELNIAKSVSGATVLLNAATTLSAYGEADRAIGYFCEVMRVFSDNLDPSDYRFAGLYNNMGTAYSNLSDFSNALTYYKAALSIVEKTDNRMEVAVTNVNIAELYSNMQTEESCDGIDRHVQAALFELDSASVRDGYYAFTCRKCAPTIDRLGYFRDARILNERADRIYAGN